MRVLALVLVVLLAAFPLLADVDWFNTPSGNIHCVVGIGDGLPADLECTIFERLDSRAMPHLTECAEALGRQFSMRERGAVTVKCGKPGSRPESPSSGNNVMRYGDTEKFGAIVCHSAESGLDCRNAERHGFSLSRRRQSVF